MLVVVVLAVVVVMVVLVARVGWYGTGSNSDNGSIDSES